MISSDRTSGKLSPWTKSVIAGSVSGMASVTICHPFDTIRTRLQLSPTRFRGFFHCAHQTIQQETMRGLYKGFLPPFFSQGVYKAVIFTTSSILRNDVLPHLSLFQPVLTPTVVSLTAGAVAGGANAFLVAPVELVRNRLQVQYNNRPETQVYRGVYHCITQVMRTEGIMAMWKGLTTTVIRDSLGVAFYFLGFDFARRRLTESGKFGKTATLLTAGAFGGINFWAVALPFDTIKTLIQADGRTGKYTSFRISVAKLIREEGIMQLFRGWQAAFFRGIPSAAITFWTFESASNILNEI
ncbi:mitochondrial carrier family [Plasmopara halstedii]|uniref:Mitochondrial carrier family n=1 Tax=Plasmopara halstedii TaxID=4781 RepID=A0A0P1B0G5_PLAHL|nr:mitochondrial carrier family [Plasmopara halstedii]CEG46783.1 mitochondrial carrier family [Plasmopara halstedii]|eukprot:XP_024583152.1 mitochondrial carrier family [Plasmopara halstedii]